MSPLAVEDLFVLFELSTTAMESIIMDDPSASVSDWQQQFNSKEVSTEIVEDLIHYSTELHQAPPKSFLNQQFYSRSLCKLPVPLAWQCVAEAISASPPSMNVRLRFRVD